MPRGNSLQTNRPQDKPQVTIAENAVTPAVLTQFFANQAEQIEVQRKEQEIASKEQDIRLKEIESTNVYSIKALDAQLADRENSRKHELAMKRTRYRYWFIAGGTTAFFSLAALGGCIAYGQAVLALDIVKTVVPPLITAIGGYFIGKNRGKAQPDTTEIPESKP